MEAAPEDHPFGVGAIILIGRVSPNGVLITTQGEQRCE
jgi:hypothetical protein